MISFDANVLIYAGVEENPFCEEARALLTKCMNEDEKIVFCWEVLHAFRRVTTNPKSNVRPLSTAVADGFINDLISDPLVQVVGPGLESWQIFKRYSSQMQFTGNLVTDAVIASQLEANGVKKLYSNDRDFRKFGYLRVIDPFAKKKRLHQARG